MNKLFWLFIIPIITLSYCIGVYNEKNTKIDYIISCQLEIIKLLTNYKEFDNVHLKFYGDIKQSRNTILALNSYLKEVCIKNKGSINYKIIYKYSKK